MKINLTSGTILAFLSLLFVCHELHEISHTAVAYAQCGCWGERDFNVWNICADCSNDVNSVWATVAGPLFTYVLIWIGFALMNSKNSIAYQSLGWALVFANKPFARIFTVLMRGGDESVITRHFTGQSTLSTIAWIVEIIIVLLLIVPPLVRAWKLMNAKRRVLIFILMLILPMLIEFVLLHKLGNGLLANGVLDDPGYLGSPVLVNIWTAVWVVVLVVMWRKLFKMIV